jgi:hypothetical protein
MAIVVAFSVSLAEAMARSTWPVCERGEALVPRLRAPCFAVHALMVESDSTVVHSIGLLRLAEWTAGTRWREGLRNYYWLRSHSVAARGNGEFDLDELVEQGELEFWRTRLQAQGRWPAPPGWLPENPGERSLVLTGRQPPRG